MPNYQRLNLNNQTLLIASNLNPPMFYGVWSDGRYHPSHGFHVSFIDLMANYFNFSWTVQDQKGVWGGRLPNGSLHGLIGALVSDRVAFGLGSVPVRLICDEDNAQLIEFTRPDSISQITFLTLNTPLQPMTGVLLLPFQLLTWLLLLLSLVVAMVVGRLFTIVTRSAIDLDWMVVCSLLQKANRFTQKGFAVQTLVQIFWFAGIILMASYGGSITSFLSRNFKPKTIDSVDELDDEMQQGNAVAIMVRATPYIGYFEKYQDLNPRFKMALGHMIPVNEYRDGFVLMTKQKLRGLKTTYAIIGQYEIMQIWSQHLNPKYFHISNQYEAAFLTDIYGLMFKRGSPLTAHFDRLILLTLEHGFFERWSKQSYPWSSKRTEIRNNLHQLNQIYNYGNVLSSTSSTGPSTRSITNSDSFIFNSLNYQDVYEELVLYWIGMATGGLCLLVEIGLYYLKTHTNNKSLTILNVLNSNKTNSNQTVIL